jgi:hypothetical protein
MDGETSTNGGRSTQDQDDTGSGDGRVSHTFVSQEMARFVTEHCCNISE